MALLSDSTGAPITYISFDLQSGETSATVRIFATAGDGAILSSGVSSSFTLKARRTGTADPFVALDAGGISLSSDPDGPVEFDLQCVADVVTGIIRDSVFIGVTGGSGAGWSV